MTTVPGTLDGALISGARFIRALGYINLSCLYRPVQKFFSQTIERAGDGQSQDTDRSVFYTRYS